MSLGWTVLIVLGLVVLVVAGIGAAGDRMFNHVDDYRRDPTAPPGPEDPP